MTATIEVITNPGTLAEEAHNLDRLVAQGVEGVAGLMAVPERRGGNLVVAGSHGELHIPNKRSGPANLVMPLWVRGVNPDGTVPGTDDNARLEFHQNLRNLIGLFREHDRIAIRHTLSDGSARQIVGEVTDAVTPDIRGAGRWTLGQFAVALNCAAPFWTDLSPVTSTITSAAPGPLPEFAGAGAWMEDLLLTFGPQNNPRLEQASTGVFVAVNRVITSGQTVVVDTATWQVYGTGGVAPGLYEDLVYGGRGTARFFALKPEPGGAPPVVALTETGVGTGSVTVTGPRTYPIA